MKAAGRQPRLAFSRPWLATAGGGCVGRDLDRGSLERLLDERGQDLMRAAVALTGSRADGEDLLQAALERLLRNWHREATDPEGYLRRTLYNLAADSWRRRGRWRGQAAAFREDQYPETPTERPRPSTCATRWSGAGPASAAAAGGGRAPVLGAAQRGADRGAAGLLGRRGEVGRVPWPAAAPRPGHHVAGARRWSSPGHQDSAENQDQADGGKAMNGDIEQLVREGLDRLTAEVQVPAGVAGKAIAHRRHQRIVTRTALACGTAAVTVAAVIAATGPGRGAGTPVQARAAAYVIQRVENALAGTNMVIQTEYTFSPRP